MEGHLRALLRDVLCGYLDADLKAVADDILVESQGEPLREIEARDLRDEEPDRPSRSQSHEPPRAPRASSATEEPVTFEPELEWEEPTPSTTPAEMEAEYDGRRSEPARDEAVRRRAGAARARRRDRVGRLGLGRPRGLLRARLSAYRYG